MRVAMYRNLHAAINQQDVYIYSVAEYKSRRSYGRKFPGAAGSTQTAILANVDAVCQTQRRAAMARDGINRKRTVAAWVTGEPVESLSGLRLPISLNPKNGETEFRYRSTGRPVVNFDDLVGLEFTPTGMLGILRS